MGIRIAGTGKYLPEKTVSNEDFTKIVDTSDEWITTRTGIKNRHVETEKLTWEMGVCAAREALAEARISPEEVDAVICSTVTADYLTPSTACLIADAIKADSPLCMDINCACAGFVNALDVAERYLQDSAYKNILIVSSEMLTKISDYTDRSTCVLFGDGAGAAVVQAGEGFYQSVLGSDPTGGKHLFMRGVPPAGQFRDTPFDPLSDGWEPTRGHCLYMNGKEVYKFSTRVMASAVEEVCQKAGLSPRELDWIFPHQANRRIIETAAKNLSLPMDHIYMNIAENGNISSACIPVSLAEASRSGLLHRGDKICLVGFGGGLVYGASVFQW